MQSRELKSWIEWCRQVSPPCRLWRTPLLPARGSSLSEGLTWIATKVFHPTSLASCAASARKKGLRARNPPRLCPSATVPAGRLRAARPRNHKSDAWPPSAIHGMFTHGAGNRRPVRTCRRCRLGSKAAHRNQLGLAKPRLWLDPPDVLEGYL